MAVLASETAQRHRAAKAKPAARRQDQSQSFPARVKRPRHQPEQLFAAGYSACFGAAIKAAAGLEKIALNPNDIKVTATVNLHKDESGALSWM